MAERWRRCSACKNDIALSAIYWVCSVSTCNRKRTALQFCSVDCWEVHLPTERHREAWAVEERAPKVPDPPPGTPQPRKKKVAAPKSTAAATPSASSTSSVSPAAGAASAASPAPARSSGVSNREVLVVASRLKAYIKAQAGFNTSDSVLGVLSDALRVICDESIENARRAERLTVMGRDVPRE